MIKIVTDNSTKETTINITTHNVIPRVQKKTPIENLY
ncbi:MAG: hypothetical protein ACI90V_013463 [Bacillariaceae sp.]|jgi:hypothetical protein